MNKYLLILIMGLLAACVKPKTELKLDPSQFPQSVASGDPSLNSVVLWTRIETADSTAAPELSWEIAKDESFAAVLQSGSVTAMPENYHTVKVIAENLEASTTYYYRFKHGNALSPMGRTQTLPADAETIKIGIVNCSSYEGGYFNGYDALSKMEGLHAVIHLGDYIYEGGSVAKREKPGNYTRAWKATGRSHQPEHEILSLSDYRTRLQQYRNDTMLQHLHERYPMINIWDDHETANNSWKDGAQNHQPETEGEWEVRKANALKAYFEWIPIRSNQDEPIYRSFEFGDVLNLIMLDTRLCCRTIQAKDEAELEEIADQSDLVGDEQMQWIQESAENSDAKWNLLGNQVLVARRYGGPEGKYISLDQWTGYPKDRKKLIDYMTAHPEENMLITTGNVHSAYHFNLLDGPDEKTGNLIAQEFAPGSISSSNIDEREDAEGVAAANEDTRSQNPHLPWFDLGGHGFIVAEFNADIAVIDWYQVSTLLDTDYELKKAYTAKVGAK